MPTPVARAVSEPVLDGRRWLSPLGALAAAFTAMCCLGVTATVSLATAVGACGARYIGFWVWTCRFV